jgi:hypothetical protein
MPVTSTFRTRFVVATALAASLFGLIQVAGALQGGEEKPHQWLVICHRTHSATNPFVVIVTAEEAGFVAHKAGGPDSPQPPGHEGDKVFGPFDSHAEAKALAAQGVSICEEEVPHLPPAPPAGGQQGAVPVTG